MTTEKTTVVLRQYPKTKMEFVDWYLNQIASSEFYLPYASFLMLPFAFQQGVFLEFLRANGIDIWFGSALGELGGYLAVLYAPEELERLAATDPTTALIAAIEAGAARLEAAKQANELTEFTPSKA